MLINQYVRRRYISMFLIVFFLLTLPLAMDTVEYRSRRSLEWHDLIAEAFIFIMIINWIRIAARLKKETSTFTYFFFGAASVAWLMEVKMINEFINGQIIIYTILELCFSISGLILLSMGLSSWANDFNAMIAALGASKDRYKLLSETDPLTGLGNRKAYEEKMNALLNQRKSFFLLLMDLDHFKLINDTYGHDEGDKVLKEISKIISGNIRKEDCAFRIGGEDFAVILTDNDSTKANDIAQRIRLLLEQRENRIDDSSIIPTMSIGVSNSVEGISASQIFRRADRALYEAKNRGRNMVVFSQD